MNTDLKRNITNRVKNTRFECINCGSCCKTAEIMLSSREIGGISYTMGMDKKEFIDEYLQLKKIEKVKTIENRTYEIKGECYIIKKREDDICPFFKENKCEIYDFRPIVCRLFPFTWEYFPEKNEVNIDYSENGWNECPGIDKENVPNWEKIREEVTGAVILSMIQSNELDLGGSLTQEFKK